MAEWLNKSLSVYWLRVFVFQNAIDTILANLFALKNGLQMPFLLI